MALRIIIDGPAGAGKSAVGRLIENTLVNAGFMVASSGIAPRTIDEATLIANTTAKRDARIVLVEVQAAVPTK